MRLRIFENFNAGIDGLRISDRCLLHITGQASSRIKTICALPGLPAFPQTSLQFPDSLAETIVLPLHGLQLSSMEGCFFKP
jgi:hypothetical protein